MAARIPLARRARRARASIGSLDDAAPIARQAGEASLRDDVVDMARRYGWRVYFPCGNALAAHRIPGRDCLYQPTPDERRRLRAAARREWNRWWSSLPEDARREYARQWWSR